MKITRYLKFTLLATILALSWVTVFGTPKNAAALTRTEQLNCYNSYNGKKFYTPDYDKNDDFRTDNCNKGSANGQDLGGNCVLGPAERVRASGQAGDYTSVKTVKCTGGFTKAERGACYDKWNKKKYLSNAALRTTFSSSLCNKVFYPGANCTEKSLGKAGLDPEDQRPIFRYQAICTKPKGYTPGSSSGTVDVDGDEETPAADIPIPEKQDPAFDNNVACSSGQTCSIIEKYIDPTIKLLSVLVGIVAVMAIIIGAIQVVTSAGDPQKASSGKNHIRNALVGLVSYVFLYAFLQWILPGGIN